MIINRIKIGINSAPADHGGVGNDFCGTEGCNFTASRNMMFCRTCMAIQSIDKDFAEGDELDNQEDSN